MPKDFLKFPFLPPFWGEKQSKMTQNDIFSQSVGDFFPAGTYRHVYDFKWYLWVTSRGTVKAIDIFSVFSPFLGVEGVKK